jgi:hypothetical protein
LSSLSFSNGAFPCIAHHFFYARRFNDINNNAISHLNFQGLSEVKVDKIKDAASKVLPSAFITGSEAASRRSTVFYISTGAKAVDAILGGGIESRGCLFLFS